MLDKMTNRLDFHGSALVLRAERQRTIASNIANADTPGYVGRDINFTQALRAATGMGSGAINCTTTGSGLGSSTAALLSKPACKAHRPATCAASTDPATTMFRPVFLGGLVGSEGCIRQ